VENSAQDLHRLTPLPHHDLKLVPNRETIAQMTDSDSILTKGCGNFQLKVLALLDMKMAAMYKYQSYTSMNTSFRIIISRQMQKL